MKSQVVTEPQKFASDILWVAISQVSVSLLSVITLPALTRSYSAELYGVWAQVGVTVGLLTPIILLHLSTAVVRFLAAEEDREKRRRAFGAMLWPVIALACFGVLISLVLRQSLSTFLFADARYVPFVPLTFLWAAVGALFTFSLSYLRARGMIKRLSVINLTFGCVQMVLIIALASAGFSLAWIIACIIGAETLFVAVVFRMIVGEIGLPRPQFQGLKGILAFSVPQIPAGILLWIINLSDRYFITHLLNLSQTGIYSVSCSLGGVLALFYSPVSFVLFPTVSKFWEQNDLSGVKNYLEYSTKLFLVLAIPAAGELYLLSQPLLQMLTTSEYLASGSLVLLVALGTLFGGIYQLNVHIIMLVKQTRWLPLMIAVAAATNAGLDIALIPRIGIMGAAVGTIVSHFVLAAIVTLWARKAVAYRLDLGFTGKVVLATAIMGICLRFIPAGGASSLAIAVIAGSAIYGLALFLLKALSKEDRKLIRGAVSGMNPRLWKGEFATRQNAPSTPGKGPKDEDKEERR